MGEGWGGLLNQSVQSLDQEWANYSPVKLSNLAAELEEKILIVSKSKM